MVSEEVCNYFMGGVITLIYILKVLLWIWIPLLVGGTVYICFKYYVDAKYGRKSEPKTRNPMSKSVRKGSFNKENTKVK